MVHCQVLPFTDSAGRGRRLANISKTLIDKARALGDRQGTLGVIASAASSLSAQQLGGTVTNSSARVSRNEDRQLVAFLAASLAETSSGSAVDEEEIAQVLGTASTLAGDDSSRIDDTAQVAAREMNLACRGGRVSRTFVHAQTLAGRHFWNDHSRSASRRPRIHHCHRRGFGECSVPSLVSPLGGRHIWQHFL